MKTKMTSQFYLKIAFFAMGMCATISPVFSQAVQEYNSFKTGGEWLDTNGVHIDCHGGNIIYVDHLKTFYWYGEHCGEPHGASCYSSDDLYNWKKEGIVMEKGEIEIFERPKVIYDQKNNRYVMWFHLFLKYRATKMLSCIWAIDGTAAGVPNRNMYFCP